MRTTRADHCLVLCALAVFSSLGVLGCSRAGLLREQILYKPGGEEWVRFTVIDVAVARKVPSNSFTFAPKKGVKVIDETEDTIRADHENRND